MLHKVYYTTLPSYLFAERHLGHAVLAAVLVVDPQAVPHEVLGVQAARVTLRARGQQPVAAREATTEGTLQH